MACRPFRFACLLCSWRPFSGWLAKQVASELDGHVLDPVDEVGPQRGDFAVEGDIGHPLAMALAPSGRWRSGAAGLTQRTISSGPAGIRAGLASSRCRCPGCWKKASMPPEAALRVVWLAPRISSVNKIPRRGQSCSSCACLVDTRHRG